MPKPSDIGNAVKKQAAPLYTVNTDTGFVAGSRDDREARKKIAINILNQNGYTNSQLAQIASEFPDLAQLIGANYSANADKKSAADATAATVISPQEQALAQSTTARQMSLLQQAMNAQRQQSISGMRSNLAQRNILDSGSVQGGIGRINRDIGQQTAQGALMAANQEGSTLLDFIRQNKQNAFNTGLADRQHGWDLTSQLMQQNQANSNRDWEQEQRRKDREAALWGGLASAGGNVAGMWLGRKV